MNDEQALIKPALNTLTDVLKSRKVTIEKILGRSINPTRFLSLISAALQQTPKLMECTPISVINCVIAAGQMGVEIRKNSAYLVPFKNKFNRMDCNLLVDYRGKISIAHRSGFVDDIRPLLVYAGDEFDYTEGTHGNFHHRLLVCRKGQDGELVPVSEEERGPVVLGYCIAQLHNGAKHVEIMSLGGIDAIRARSKTAFKNGQPRPDSPWTTDWEQMARKTLVHRIFNYLPQDEAMAISQDVDERFEMETPIDHLLLPASEEEDTPMVKVGEEVREEIKETKLKETPKPTASEKKLHSIPRSKPIEGVPVLAELPPVDQVTHLQRAWVGGKQYEFDGELNCWVALEVPE